MNETMINDALIESALRKYYKYKAYEFAGDKAIDKVLGNEDRDLGRKEKMLSIMQKQRELGLPMDSSDYEDATNGDKSFYSQIMNSTGKRVLQAIPGPRLLDPKPQPFFRIAEAITDELPSMKQSKSIGGKYGRYAARAASALFAI